MAKKESTFGSMVLTLFLVALISSAGVGFVHEVTREPIAQARAAKKIAAIKDVAPEFNNDPVGEGQVVETPTGLFTVYPARQNGVAVGAAVEAGTLNGFGGRISLMVGFLADGTIRDIAVLDHKETPGLGDKMEKTKSNFITQFQGKQPDQFRLSVKKDGGDVDAITAATVTSRAFCDAVRQAYLMYKENGTRFMERTP